MSFYPEMTMEQYTEEASKLSHDSAWAAYEKWCKLSGWSQTKLADEIGASRSALNQVLNGKRTGGPTWRRVVKVLPMDGLLLLQQCSAWNRYAEVALEKRRAAEAETARLVDLGARCRGEAVVSA